MQFVDKVQPKIEEEEPKLEKKTVKIMGIGLPYFLGIFALVLIAMYLEILPSNIMGGLAVAMSFGLLLMWIGNSIPFFNTLGGGPILCIIIPGLFLYLGLIPESAGVLADNFYNEYGFAELVVVGLIVGSLLGMDRDLLIKVGIRFFVPLVGGTALTFIVGGFVGELLGFGFWETIFFIIGPIMGGGMAAGAVPMSEIYAQYGDIDPSAYLALIAPSIMVGNMFCILIGGTWNLLGKKKNMPKWFSGEGKILRKHQANMESKESKTKITLQNLAIGVILAAGMYLFGEIASNFVPVLHAYVFIIVGAALLKIFNVFPEYINQAAGQWYDFISSAWVPAVLVAISLGMINFGSVIDIIMNPSYLTLTVLTVLLAALGAGFVGVLVGFYFVESSITAGLGMADMGGSGDVAVLSASGRMQLMPIMQIASRIGGALVLVVLSILAPLFL